VGGNGGAGQQGGGGGTGEGPTMNYDIKAVNSLYVRSSTSLMLFLICGSGIHIYSSELEQEHMNCGY
jgi:hypothetical protein